MKIGLMGISLSNANKGVVALTYSIVFLLEKISRDKGTHFQYIIFVPRQENKPDEIVNMCKALQLENIDLKATSISITDHRVRSEASKEITSCNLIIDLSLGDSFSDIYGTKRFIYYSYFKMVSIFSKVPLLMGPQTYGPFKLLFNRQIAKYILNHSICVVARDAFSAQYIEKITRITPLLTTDIAFFLPFDKEMYSISCYNEKKVGLNISRLLWEGGYVGKNEFDLCLNYKELIIWLIDWIHERGYRIFLIPHVIDKECDSVENDYYLCEKIAKDYDFIEKTPYFNNPVEIKSFISNLDVLIGSRMHATIAAISSGVPAIPISYSRKFEGLYSTLGYNVGINGITDSTEKAMMKMMSYLNNIDELKRVLNSRKEFIDAIKINTYKILEDTVKVNE